MQAQPESTLEWHFQGNKGDQGSSWVHWEWVSTQRSVNIRELESRQHWESIQGDLGCRESRLERCLANSAGLCLEWRFQENSESGQGYSLECIWV